MPIHPCRTVAAALTLCSFAHAGGLQNGWKSFRDPTIQDHGYEWAKVGHAGNADWVGLQLPFGPVVRVGGVDHRYRIAKTEVTNRQWFEFVQAYAPFVSDQFDTSNQFIGTGIGITGGGGYTLAAPSAERAATVGWRFAARYVNWLHNDKINEQWAFESGVYETSTFGPFSGGGAITDQAERSEGARYFIPTLDEWIKAAHFDPDRYGEGQEGYWLYPTTSDTAPVPGAPGAPGAETNAGAEVRTDVMGYPNVTSPWGLFDASGSAKEWLETLTPLGEGRLTESSNSDTNPSVDYSDLVSNWDGRSPSSLIGVRIASVVPGPGVSMLALTALLVGRTRRR